MGMDFEIHDKAARIMTRQSGSAHAMTLIAVDTDENDTPVKWQFENSWGPDAGHNGYFTFTDEWFDEYMFRMVIRKEYLSGKAVEALSGGVRDASCVGLHVLIRHQDKGPRGRRRQTDRLAVRMAWQIICFISVGICMRGTGCAPAVRTKPGICRNKGSFTIRIKKQTDMAQETNEEKKVQEEAPEQVHEKGTPEKILPKR